MTRIGWMNFQEHPQNSGFHREGQQFRIVLSRRQWLQSMGLALTGAGQSKGQKRLAKAEAKMNPISALTPRNAAGHQFVVYADCCSGRPGTQQEKNFAAC